MVKKKMTDPKLAATPVPMKKIAAVVKAAKTEAAPMAAKTVRPAKAEAPVSVAANEAVNNGSRGSIASLAEAVEAHAPDPERIAQIAYLMWLDRGCPQGSPAEDWYRAESALHGQTLSATH